MRVNQDGGTFGWAVYDPETVYSKDEQSVDHVKSAGQDMRAMGEDWMHAVIPLDRAIEEGIDHKGNPLWILLGLLSDVLEFPFTILMTVKHIIDAIVHLCAAGINRIQGITDPSEDTPVKELKFCREDSIQRQTANLIFPAGFPDFIGDSIGAVFGRVPPPPKPAFVNMLDPPQSKAGVCAKTPQKP